MKDDDYTKEELIAQCTAYRHAIKDVVREPDEAKMKEALARLLADEHIGTIGRDFHFIIKHAVQMVHYAELADEPRCREATALIFKKVKELENHATITGWLTA